MKKLTLEEKTELRETLEKENKRMFYEQTFGGSFSTVRRRKDLTPSQLASHYGVSISQIKIAAKDLI
tara:strand:- start:42 stop:242 length:201 start_codon:yes stop_codon:yes gene_type:complete